MLMLKVKKKDAHAQQLMIFHKYMRTNCSKSIVKSSKWTQLMCQTPAKPSESV
jgi:hypothetical protein